MTSVLAFDPLAGEEAREIGRLTILQARMNPDLAMGDELLKKTGTGKAWATINSTISRPVPSPSTGKVAVKVINHYGDEVMKVFRVIGNGSDGTETKEP